MSAAAILAHFLLPSHANNFKAKILHSSSLFVIAGVLLMLYVVRVPTHVARVLGLTATSLPVQALVELTNQKRAQSGFSSLRLDPTLSSAAAAKGQDMLAKGYWAHVAPDGTTPWTFFLSSGYEYRYAGENLARDFDSPEQVVNAWIASPTHRDNMLSGKYQDIGIAVVQGELSGKPTTIVVQLLGTRLGSSAPIQVAQNSTEPTPVVSTPQPTPSVAPTAVPSTVQASISPTVTPSSQAQPTPAAIVAALPTPASGGPLAAAAGITLISPFSLQRNVGMTIVGMLLLVLVFDAVALLETRVVRIGARHLAHFGFLVSIGMMLFITQRGSIL
ncbi:hypothetical protein HYV21_02705 [Candidatus Microgenomates bacterium]|nr:hypothetical protein [Candidatus Microgenomates bacterium]